VDAQKIGQLLLRHLGFEFLGVAVLGGKAEQKAGYMRKTVADPHVGKKRIVDKYLGAHGVQQVPNKVRVGTDEFEAEQKIGGESVQLHVPDAGEASAGVIAGQAARFVEQRTRLNIQRFAFAAARRSVGDDDSAFGYIINTWQFLMRNNGFFRIDAARREMQNLFPFTVRITDTGVFCEGDIKGRTKHTTSTQGRERAWYRYFNP